MVNEKFANESARNTLRDPYKKHHWQVSGPSYPDGRAHIRQTCA